MGSEMCIRDRLLSSSNSVKTLGDQLLEAVRQRVLGVPPPPPAENQGSTPASDTRMAILFSGGLDCTVLARLSHDLLPNDHSIDLLNVAFENPRIASHLQKQARGAEVDAYEACPDRVTGRKALAELQKACPGRNFRFVAVCSTFFSLFHTPELTNQLCRPTSRIRRQPPIAHRSSR